MKKELQIILLSSIVICLAFMTQMLIEATPAIDQKLFSGITTWQAPTLTKPDSTVNPPEISKNPFALCFFEKASLKGFIRNSNNDWCAIFASPSGEALIIEPGISRKGLTLVSANGRYCRVKFGSVIREFKL